MSLIPPSVSEQKRVLRAHLRDLRTEKSKIISNAANRLVGIFKANVKLEDGLVIGSFIAFNDEIDPSPLADILRLSGHKIALPRIIAKDTPLAFHLYQPGDRLAQNPFGMDEPLPDAPLVDPDILLVPLLGFDASRNRLGYGGGYYDRTIAALRTRKPVMAIGIGYSFQQVDAIPTRPHDITMDKIVTELGAF